MWRTASRRGWTFTGLAMMTALALVGAGPPKRKRPEPPPPKVEETIKDLAWVYSTGEVRLEGVGLVFGLDNTGADPPPSWYRQKLVDEMRKAQVENPNMILKDKRFSLVIVRARFRPEPRPPTGSTSSSSFRRPAGRRAWPVATCCRRGSARSCSPAARPRKGAIMLWRRDRC